MYRVKLAAVLGLLIGFVAVSGCDLFSDSSSGRVILRLTDAPLQVEAVNVSLTGLTLIDTKSGHRESVDLGTVAQNINLLAYQGGHTLTVADLPVTIEQFDRLRLVVDEEATIQVDGVIHDLRIPSGASSGIKFFLKEPVVLNGGTFDITVDFDAEESVVPIGPPHAPKGYVLRPVIRPVSASLNETDLPFSLVPVLANPGDQEGTEGDSVMLPIEATDPDNDPMNFDATGLPPGLSIDTGTGEITGTLEEAGDYTVTVEVSDDDGATSVEFSWVVSSAAANAAWLESVIAPNVAVDRWTTVTLKHTYETMVTVCTVVYYNNGSPVVVRLRNAAGNRFDVRLQNPRGALLARETVYCLVAEEGAWQLADGRSVEARRYLSRMTDDNDSWIGEPQSYSIPFTSPVVLGQVMSHNDADWSVFWSRGETVTDPPSAVALWTGKHAGEDVEASRADEEIGFLVFESGSGTLEETAYTVALGADMVRGIADGAPFMYDFDPEFSSAPAVGIATMSGMDGRDGGWAILYGNTAMTASQMQLAIDEDRLMDVERSHTTEQVAYAVFGETTGIALTRHPLVDPQ